jgi:hypothetical protein
MHAVEEPNAIVVAGKPYRQLTVRLPAKCWSE